MSLFVILQPFAREHLPRFWSVLENRGLHPLPLTEAREICLNEDQMQELVSSIRDFDILEPHRATGKPFTVLPLDLTKFGEHGQSEYLRRRTAEGKLATNANFVVHGLTITELCKHVEFSQDAKLCRTLAQRRRLAWLSDGLLWAKSESDHRILSVLFDGQSDQAAA